MYVNADHAAFNELRKLALEFERPEPSIHQVSYMLEQLEFCATWFGGTFQRDMWRPGQTVEIRVIE